jgi:hypothetical protein
MEQKQDSSKHVQKYFFKNPPTFQVHKRPLGSHCASFKSPLQTLALGRFSWPFSWPGAEQLGVGRRAGWEWVEVGGRTHHQSLATIPQAGLVMGYFYLLCLTVQTQGPKTVAAACGNWLVSHLATALLPWQLPPGSWSQLKEDG